jgi:hypothetical protein
VNGELPGRVFGESISREGASHGFRLQSELCNRRARKMKKWKVIRLQSTPSPAPYLKVRLVFCGDGSRLCASEIH